MSWFMVVKSPYYLVEKLKELGLWETVRIFAGQKKIGWRNNIAQVALLTYFNKSPEEWAELSKEIREQAIEDFIEKKPNEWLKMFDVFREASIINEDNVHGIEDISSMTKKWNFYLINDLRSLFNAGDNRETREEYLKRAEKERKKDSVKTGGTDADLRDRLRRRRGN